MDRENLLKRHTKIYTKANLKMVNCTVKAK